MAFEFDKDAMFKACALYLSKGMLLVRVHGIWLDGRCTCGRKSHAIGKSEERSVGKHPVGDDWASHVATTEDDILDWMEDGVPFNVGILLGPAGKMIDNENDSPEAANFRKSLGMDDLETWTFMSGKSIHQITQWDDSLSSCKGTAQPGGLEVRIGAGDTSIQSVLPPSWHRSGVQYRWRPGFSPDDIDIAPTPKRLLSALVNQSDGRPASDESPAKTMLFGEIPDGKRHRAVLRWTWFKIVNQRNPFDRLQQEILTREVLLLNDQNCKPPGDPKKVRQIISDCYAHYHKRTEAGWKPSDNDLKEECVDSEIDRIENGSSGAKAPASGSGLELYGLKKVTVGKVEAYEPGDWSIQMIHADPPEIVLCVPAWEATACHGRIQMSFDTFRSAPKMASAIFVATRQYILDGDSGRWQKIWKGHDACKANGFQSVPGLMELLMTRKREEDNIYVGTSSLRYAQLASYVLQVFRKATQPKSEEKPEPNESGRPCWVTPDKLWFQWGKVWDDIGRTHDVMPGERNRVRSRLLDIVGSKDFIHERHRFAAGRLEYVVFDDAWIKALESLAAGEDRPPSENPPNTGASMGVDE